MQKRGIFTFSIILLLVLMPSAFSIYSESVYSGTVEDKDILDISGHAFKFRIDPVSSKVYIEIDVSGVIISSNECKIKDSFEICIGNVSFSYRNYEDYYDVYKAVVDVSQIKSQIDVTNTIQQSNLLIEEETTAEMAVENTADVVAEDVTAVISIPQSISVTDLEGCKKISGNIVFEGDVYPTQVRKCTYRVTGLSGGDFELKANVTYFDGTGQVSATSGAVSGKVYNYSLKISPQLNKSRFGIQEKFNLAIDIENINDQYDLQITALSIKIPEKLLLLERPEHTSGNDRLISWSGTLEAGEKKSLIMQLQGQITGNHSVPVEASYKISKFLRTAKSTPNIEVYCDCPYISHDFSQQIMVPDQRVTLNAFLINPSAIHHFKNVKLSYITNVPNIQNYSAAYSSIRPFESIKIFDSPIITPPLDETYYFNATAIYESSANQVFVIDDRIIIKVPGEEETPATEEKTELEEQQETGELILGIEESEEAGEEEKEEESDDVPVTTIEYEEKRPIKVYIIIASIAALIFISILLTLFKIKKNKKSGERGVKELDTAAEKKQITKRPSSNIFSGIKKKIRIKPKGYKKEEMEYRDLERQISGLGTIPERKKYQK
jgi:hypothetical protein